MGLSIHYSGTIRDLVLIDELVSETEDICKSLEWEYHILQQPNDDQLKGIIFSPAESEPVVLTFLPSGRMCSPFNLMNKDIYDHNGLDADLIYTSSTKTQYAGPDTHQALIKLLSYLSEKYFSVFELEDEGMYWETKDRGVLLSQFARYDFLLDTVANALGEMKSTKGETITSLADRIEQMLKDRFGKSE